MWLYAFVILLMTNLNAIVDMFYHPDIPYLDEEHLVVGLISGAVSAPPFRIALAQRGEGRTPVPGIHSTDLFILQEDPGS